MITAEISYTQHSELKSIVVESSVQFLKFNFNFYFCSHNSFHCRFSFKCLLRTQPEDARTETLLLPSEQGAQPPNRAAKSGVLSQGQTLM